MADIHNQLTDLELRLKKLATLAKNYTDQKAAAEKVYLFTAPESGTTEGYLKTYVLAAGTDVYESALTPEHLIGKIDIPKDYLVKAAHIEKVESIEGSLVITEIDGVAQEPPYATAPTGITAAGTWLDFTINVMSGTTDESHIYINVSELVNTYAAGNGIDITNNTIKVDLTENGGLEFSGDTEGTKTLKAKVKAENGLSITESGITLDLAAYTPASGETPAAGNAGAMSSDDKRVVDYSNTDLLNDEELASWFPGATADDISGITRDPYSPTPTPPTTPEILGVTPFTDSTTVSISSETAGASVYYTTNGDTPTAESTPYTEPFGLNNTATVKAIAIKDGVPSSVAEKEFTKQGD